MTGISDPMKESEMSERNEVMAPLGMAAMCCTTSWEVT